MNLSPERREELIHNIRKLVDALSFVTKAETESSHFEVKAYYVGLQIRIDVKEKPE